MVGSLGVARAGRAFHAAPRTPSARVAFSSVDLNHGGRLGPTPHSESLGASSSRQRETTMLQRVIIAIDFSKPSAAGPAVAPCERPPAAGPNPGEEPLIITEKGGFYSLYSMLPVTTPTGDPQCRDSIVPYATAFWPPA